VGGLPTDAQDRANGFEGKTFLVKKAPGVSAAARNSSTVMFSQISPVGSRKEVPKNRKHPTPGFTA
jgi:hypothetical protein